MALTTEQQSLVDLVATGDADGRRPRICALTGGPGVGKTHTIAGLIERLRALGITFAIAAPSGKAAQRCEEALRGTAKASTIHRLLCMRPDSGEHEPLEQSVVIVDEASMIDVRLFAHLIRACFEGGGKVETLLLVGDPDQLPPVGPGQPFLDLLAATKPGLQIPTVRLTVVQRQALLSGIVRAAHAIRAGEEPEWADDFRLVECEAAADVPGTILSVIDELGIDAVRSQVLAPQNTTVAGCDAINKFIEGKREGLPPPLRDRLRLGTKVIVTKNDYQLQVFNGETGFVVVAKAGAKPAQDVVEVELGGQVARRVVFRGAAINTLQQAWALTVHRSQGSEYLDVVLVAHRAHSYMLSRSLLYVACTRARERVIVIGQKDTVARAVRRDDDQQRTTLLQRWLGSARRGA
jgi:exodeoxyribonuclease V alpha subunit